MASLPTIEGGRSAGLSSSLAASVVGLVAGAAIMLAVVGGLFGGEAAGIAPEVQNSKVAVAGGALNDRIETLEELNSFYLIALDRMNQNQPSSITPPAELGRLYDMIVSRVVVESLSLEQINVMFDEAIREAMVAARN